MSAKPTRSFQFVFLGEPCVGKTSLLTRYKYEKFSSKYHGTRALDFSIENICFEDETVRLNFWDMSGQEMFRSTLIPCYIRKCNVAVIVYDVTNAASFQQTSKWIDLVREKRREGVVVVLVGTKTDLSEERKVSTEEGAQQAEKLNIQFAEISAKSGSNVRAFFRNIVDTVRSVQPKDRADEVKIELNVGYVRPARRCRRRDVLVFMMTCFLLSSMLLVSYFTT